MHPEKQDARRGKMSLGLGQLQRPELGGCPILEEALLLQHHLPRKEAEEAPHGPEEGQAHEDQVPGDGD